MAEADLIGPDSQIFGLNFLYFFYIYVYYRRILFIYKYKKSNRIPSEHNAVCLTFIKGDLVFVKRTFLSQINGSG